MDENIHPTYQLTLHLFKRTVFIHKGIIILGNVTLGYAVKFSKWTHVVMMDQCTWMMVPTRKDPPMAYNPSIPFDWMMAHNPSIPLKWMMAFPSTTLCSQLIIHTSLFHRMMVLLRTTYDHHNLSIPFSWMIAFLRTNYAHKTIHPLHSSYNHSIDLIQ